MLLNRHNSLQQIISAYMDHRYPPPSSRTRSKLNTPHAASGKGLEGLSTAKTGGYATANRIIPSTSPSHIFCNTSREVFGRLTQCRTNHGYTGEFRRRFLLQEDFRCPCGEEVQTREHIITQCVIHEEKRDALRKISRDLWLPTILGTKEGIVALTTFLKETTAFTRDGKHYKLPTTPTFDQEPEDPDDPEDPADTPETPS
jgi:hypothetical protein